MVFRRAMVVGLAKPATRAAGLAPPPRCLPRRAAGTASRWASRAGSSWCAMRRARRRGAPGRRGSERGGVGAGRAGRAGGGAPGAGAPRPRSRRRPGASMAQRIVAARRDGGPFADVEDRAPRRNSMHRRCSRSPRPMRCSALVGIGIRAAWAVAGVDIARHRDAPPARVHEEGRGARAAHRGENMLVDYRASVFTLKRHPIALLREEPSRFAPAGGGAGRPDRTAAGAPTGSSRTASAPRRRGWSS